MIVDAHVHLWRREDSDGIWIARKIDSLARDFTRDELHRHCVAAGVDHVIVVQAAASEAETRALLALAARDSFILGVVGWVDLEQDPGAIAAVLDEMLEIGPLLGIRAQPPQAFDRTWLDSPRCRAAFGTLARRGLPVDLLANCDQLDAVRDLARAVPEARLVLNHGGRPYVMTGDTGAWARDIAQLAREPGMVCKLSGLIERAGVEWTAAGLRPWIATLLETFGCERLIFASNWPVLNTMGSYAGWWAALAETLDHLGVDSAGRAALLGGTAAQVYGFETRGEDHPR